LFLLKNKTIRFCILAMVISFAILSIVFNATDDLAGDKEFSEYTHNDWSKAMLPLSLIIVSGLSTLAFAGIIIVQSIKIYPVITDYFINRRFSDLEPDTEFLAFDHDGFKRACCRCKGENGLWICVSEYDLKSRSWKILEEGRFLENSDGLQSVLHKEYHYDRVMIFYKEYLPQ